MYSGLVLGHSFVTSLNDSLNRPGAQEVARQLQVDHYVRNLYLHGVRGGKVPDMQQQIDSCVVNEVHFAILEIGSNDIACGRKCDDIISDIRNLTNHMKNSIPTIKYIFLCSVLYRKNITNERIDSINRSLHSLARTRDFLIFHTHKHLKDKHPSFFSKDLIHVNNKEGRQLYKKSLGRAIFTAVKLLDECKPEVCNVKNLIYVKICTGKMKVIY